MKQNTNKNFTTFAGLKIYQDLWDKYGLQAIFDSIPKQSGKPTSKIIQNLFFRNLIDANSLTALSEKDKEEFFLIKNSSLHRTSYGRNLKKLSDEQRKNILLRFNRNFIRKDEIDQDTIMIYDTTAVRAEGRTYEETKWVYDTCEEKMIKGYALNKLLLATEKKLTVLDFELQNEDKDKTLEMFKQGRRQFGVNKVVIDAGRDLKGMDFYKKLDKEGFLFYTKATKNWYFNFGRDYKVEELRKRMIPRLKEENIISLQVWKEDMPLRLIFVLGDSRTFLTNDLEISEGKVYSYYKRRWNIEISFREEKQNLGLNILPSRDFNGIKTHFLLVLLAFILSQVILAKSKIARITQGIKLIKRKIVKVFALVIRNYNNIKLEFDIRYKHWWIFDLEF